MAAKDEMRKRIQKSQSDLRKKKAEEKKKKDELKVQTRKNPFHRKHGDSAEKKRIQSLEHLSKKEKKKKIKNIDAGVPNKSITKSTKTTKVKGRKLSPYEMKKAERIQAMKDRAKKRHEAWKKSKGRK